MMPLLAEAALRTLLAALVVGLALRLCRVRHAQVEATAWTMVLLAGLAMPLLMQLTLYRLPAAIVLLPHRIVDAAVPALPAHHLAALHRALPVDDGWQPLRLLPVAYGLVAATLLLRLAAGLVMTRRIVHRARPIRAAWTRGADVRVTARVAAPVTFGRTILVPVSFITWSDAKRRAVMGHEGAHVAHHDFAVQVLSQLHTAVFWFSPLAWWLERRLARLAETTSDAAAIAQIGSPLDYAEILLDIAAGARRAPGDPSARGLSAGIAMARPALLRARVEQILGGAVPPALLSPGRRLLLASSLVPGLLLAGGLSWHAKTADLLAFSQRVGTALPAFPALPALPALPAAAGGRATFVVLLPGRHAMVSGEGGAVERLRALGDKVPGEAILFLHGAAAYAVTDPSLVEQAADAFRPERDLEGQQRDLEDQQRALDQEQAELGRQQGEIGRQMGELGRREGERMAALATRASYDGSEAAGAARAEAEAEFKADMAELASRQRELGLAQGRLSAAQAKLAAAESRLGEAGQRLAREGDAQVVRLLDRALADGTAQPAG